MASLRQRAELTTQQFENWKPTEGEMIVGEIVGGDIFHHQLYGEQKVMKVKTDDGRNLCVFLNNWLMKALQMKDVVTGDAIALTFLGKSVSKNGLSFNRFHLDVMK